MRENVRTITKPFDLIKRGHFILDPSMVVKLNVIEHWFIPWFLGIESALVSKLQVSKCLFEPRHQARLYMKLRCLHDLKGEGVVRSGGLRDV